MSWITGSGEQRSIQGLATARSCEIVSLGVIAVSDGPSGGIRRGKLVDEFVRLLCDSSKLDCDVCDDRRVRTRL